MALPFLAIHGSGQDISALVSANQRMASRELYEPDLEGAELAGSSGHQDLDPVFQDVARFRTQFAVMALVQRLVKPLPLIPTLVPVLTCCRHTALTVLPPTVLHLQAGQGDADVDPGPIWYFTVSRVTGEPVQFGGDQRAKHDADLITLYLVVHPLAERRLVDLAALPLTRIGVFAERPTGDGERVEHCSRGIQPPQSSGWFFQ